MWDAIVSNADKTLGMVFLNIVRACLQYPLVVLGMMAVFGALIGMLLMQIAWIDRARRRADAQSMRQKQSWSTPCRPASR